MARPQVEDGHLKIANELADALSKTYFSPAESKVFWTILRRTYGWNKKTDSISYSQFEEATRLDRRHIGPALKRLINRNIINFSNSGVRKISEYGLQKDYERWILTPKQVTESVTDLSNSVITETGNSSDTDLSNKLTLISVTEDKDNLLPITVSSDTDLGQSDTDLSNKSVTDLSNHKRQKTITKDILQKTEYARARGEFKNVFIGDENYQKLCQRFSQQWTDNYIEQLSGYQEQNPKNAKKYTNHYATVRNWLLRDGRGNEKPQGSPGRAKVYTEGPDYPEYHES